MKGREGASVAIGPVNSGVPFRFPRAWVIAVPIRPLPLPLSRPLSGSAACGFAARSSSLLTGKVIPRRRSRRRKPQDSNQQSIPRPTRYLLNMLRSMNPVSTSPRRKFGLSMICRCSGMVVLIGATWNSPRRPLHRGDGLGAGGAVDDQLADHAVVIRRDAVAGVDVRVQPHARPAGQAQLLDQRPAKGRSCGPGPRR